MEPTVLAVDDDLSIRRLLQRVLTLQGYTVATAADGRTALQILVASPPDLLITNLVMQGLTGWSVFARARQQVPTLPIIVISGVDPRDWFQERSVVDRVAFLRKPFALDQLLATVARLLAGTQPERDTMLAPIDDEDAAGRWVSPRWHGPPSAREPLHSERRHPG